MSDKTKIVILDGCTLNPGDLSWKGFEDLGEVIYYDRTPEDQIAERIGDAEIVITNKTVLTGETLSLCPSIKYIGVLATGYNIVDIDAATEGGIPVCNIPTYGTAAVSQFVFALLLNICNGVQQHSQSVKNGDWSTCPDFTYWRFTLTELAGKTMGIIGFGRIGQATAKIAQAFGMNVLAFDEYQDKQLESATMTYVSLDEVMSQSDVISLHCPLFDSTRGMINRSSISKMKDGVILINTSRGPLVVEEDLAEALNSGKIRAAGLDVVNKEPIEDDNILLKAKNCYITPHIAWAPLESRRRLMDIAVENLASFLNGKTINRVN